jgi:DNA-binding response OmpR family regulator
MQEILDNNLNVRTESAKLWNNLSNAEQHNLLRFLAGDLRDNKEQVLESLRQNGILAESEDGTHRIFGRLFQDFAQRQGMIQKRTSQGVRIDVESGTVWVDGKPIPDLTNLEYRLLLLLYGSLDRTCDKYKIVEAVWSEDYIHEVDDARIEKLVSRLRQKIEPIPGEPRYLLTIRGRGYRLASPSA